MVEKEKQQKIEKEKQDTKKAEVPKEDEKKESKVETAKKMVEEKIKEKTQDKKEEKKEEKIELEREYVVPLRKNFLKAQNYKRAKKAVKVLKEFIAKHMKVEERDLNKVKIDKYLNNEIWHRGIKNPLHKVKVKAVKKGGIVYVELAELPDIVKFTKARHEKRSKKVDKKKTQAIAQAAQQAQEAPKEETEDTKEKEEASREAGMKENKAQAKAAQHTTSPKSKKTMPVTKKLK